MASFNSIVTVTFNKADRRRIDELIEAVDDIQSDDCLDAIARAIWEWCIMSEYEARREHEFGEKFLRHRHWE